MNKIIFGAILQLFSLAGLTAMGAPSGFAVSQVNNLVIVKTPWGSNTFLGPVGIEELRHYSFEIPLSDLRSMNRSERGKGESSSGTDEKDTSPDQASTTGSVDSLILEANHLYHKGEVLKALGFVDEVLRRDPKQVRAWIMKGSLMHAQGQKDLALEAWKKGLELDPNNTQLQNIIGSQP